MAAVAVDTKQLQSHSPPSASSTTPAPALESLSLSALYSHDTLSPLHSYSVLSLRTPRRTLVPVDCVLRLLYTARSRCREEIRQALRTFDRSLHAWCTQDAECPYRDMESCLRALTPSHRVVVPPAANSKQRGGGGGGARSVQTVRFVTRSGFNALIKVLSEWDVKKQRVADMFEHRKALCDVMFEGEESDSSSGEATASECDEAEESEEASDAGAAVAVSSPPASQQSTAAASSVAVTPPRVRAAAARPRSAASASPRRCTTPARASEQTSGQLQRVHSATAVAGGKGQRSRRPQRQAAHESLAAAGAAAAALAYPAAFSAAVQPMSSGGASPAHAASTLAASSSAMRNERATKRDNMMLQHEAQQRLEEKEQQLQQSASAAESQQWPEEELEQAGWGVDEAVVVPAASLPHLLQPPSSAELSRKRTAEQMQASAPATARPAAYSNIPLLPPIDPALMQSLEFSRQPTPLPPPAAAAAATAAAAAAAAPSAAVSSLLPPALLALTPLSVAASPLQQQQVHATIAYLQSMLPAAAGGSSVGGGGGGGGGRPVAPAAAAAAALFADVSLPFAALSSSVCSPPAKRPRTHSHPVAPPAACRLVHSSFSLLRQRPRRRVQVSLQMSNMQVEWSMQAQEEEEQQKVTAQEAHQEHKSRRTNQHTMQQVQ